MRSGVDDESRRFLEEPLGGRGGGIDWNVPGE